MFFPFIYLLFVPIFIDYFVLSIVLYMIFVFSWDLKWANNAFSHQMKKLFPNKNYFDIYFFFSVLLQIAVDFEFHK